MNPPYTVLTLYDGQVPLQGFKVRTGLSIADENVAIFSRPHGYYKGPDKYADKYEMAAHFIARSIITDFLNRSVEGRMHPSDLSLELHPRSIVLDEAEARRVITAIENKFRGVEDALDIVSANCSLVYVTRKVRIYGYKEKDAQTLVEDIKKSGIAEILRHAENDLDIRLMKSFEHVDSFRPW